MKRLTYDRVIDAEITGQRMERWPPWPREAFDGVLDVVEQGQHIFHEDFALPPALAVKAAHDLLEVLMKLLGLRL
jgi:hypothetical protein